LIPSALSNNPTTMEIAMSCQDNDRIYEDLNEKIGNYTVNQFINICETYKIQGAVNQIDSIIGELIDIKMENECE